MLDPNPTRSERVALATARYIYLCRVWHYLCKAYGSRNDSLLLVERIKNDCISESGAQLKTLWSIADVLLNQW